MKRFERNQLRCDRDETHPQKGTTPTFPRAGARAEYTLTDGSKALEVVDDRNDVGHVFRYSVYQTGFLGLFVFKLQCIWKFGRLDSARAGRRPVLC